MAGFERRHALIDKGGKAWSSTLVDLKAQVERLTASQQELPAQIDQKHKQVEGLHQELARTRQKLEEAQARADDHKTEAQRHMDDHGKLSDAHGTLKAESTMRQRELEELHSKVAELSAENERLRSSKVCALCCSAGCALTSLSACC